MIKIFSLGVSIEITNSFDTVNQALLLEKLENCGILGLALDWFRSYLGIGNRLLRRLVASMVPSPNPGSCASGSLRGQFLGPFFFDLKAL